MKTAAHIATVNVGIYSGIICIMKTAAHVATVNVGIYSGIICIMKTAAHVAQWTHGIIVGVVGSLSVSRISFGLFRCPTPTVLRSRAALSRCV